ncbi:rRNA maturation RNase YbeY [bacterium]|nr:rRNA maturation RNase YbeY [bacterium]
MKESDLSVHCRIEVSDVGWKVDTLRLKGLVTSVLNLMRPEMAAIPGVRRAIGVSCYFVPSTEIRDLNRDLRGIDAVTDMLSFPLGYAMPGTGWILGDIVICLDAVQEKAVASGNQMRDQLAFSLVHSLLHLVGLDHLAEKDRLIMERREEELFGELASGNLPEVAVRLT